jgi:hypothetical protein
VNLGDERIELALADLAAERIEQEGHRSPGLRG